MSKSDAASTQADLEALEALQADASELECIETLLDRFNVFETIGVVNDELRHSNFLAFLLNPKRNDGLRDLFLKELLRGTLATAQDILAPSRVKDLDRVFKNLDSMDLGQTLVYREHHHIDILLTSEPHKLAVIIENKIGSLERPDQLEEYYDIVKHIYPDWDVFGVYLTPYGAAPTQKAYVPFTYGAVCDIMDSILSDRSSTLDSDVKIAMEHYVRMVRRQILGDPEIIRQSHEIYEKHTRAIDLICKHRPNVQDQIKEIVEALIKREDRLELDRSRRDWISFGVRNWDRPALLKSTDPTPAGRMLLFEFWNEPYVLNLNLFIRPGPKEICEELRKIADGNREVFMKPQKFVGRYLIFQHPILSYDYYEGVSHKEREREIRRQWHKFLDDHLPRIDAALKKNRWIWEQEEASS